MFASPPKADIRGHVWNVRWSGCRNPFTIGHERPLLVWARARENRLLETSFGWRSWVQRSNKNADVHDVSAG